MSSVKLVWITPDAEKHIMYCARVSSNNQDSTNTKLLSYLIKHKHWSPFEMASMCVEIETTRAISAQILRHRSFSFQEFSQRYAETTELVLTDARRQDLKNRQNSIDDLSEETKINWLRDQQEVFDLAQKHYKHALEMGIAKECARMILPMSSKTKLYMSGTIRSFIHYVQVRCDESTQLEHRHISNNIKDILSSNLPSIKDLLISP